MFSVPGCDRRRELWFVVGLGAVWLGFAALYAHMHRIDETHFQFSDGLVDPLYFSLTTTATVGYGDMHPRSRSAKIVVMAQQILVAIQMVSLACLLLGGSPKK